jgi:hypothetical protein
MTMSASAGSGPETFCSGAPFSHQDWLASGTGPTRRPALLGPLVLSWRASDRAAHAAARNEPRNPPSASGNCSRRAAAAARREPRIAGPRAYPGHFSSS